VAAGLRSLGNSQAKPPAPPFRLNELKAMVGQAFSLPTSATDLTLAGCRHLRRWSLHGRWLGHGRQGT
jgi:hypothetical protein